jgi:hypothetical protein
VSNANDNEIRANVRENISSTNKQNLQIAHECIEISKAAVKQTRIRILQQHLKLNSLHEQCDQLTLRCVLQHEKLHQQHAKINEYRSRSAGTIAPKHKNVD